MAEVKDLTEARSRSEKEKEATAAANGNGGKKSLEEMAAEEEERLAEDDEGQVLLDFGDQQNLSLKGKKPQDSEIKIKAISRPIKGQLGDKGDDEYTTFLVRGRLDKVEFISKRDGDGKVTSKTRRHVLSPISVLPITDEQADMLEDAIG